MPSKRRRLSLRTATLSWVVGWAVVAMIALKQIPVWSDGGIKTAGGRWGSAVTSFLQEDSFSQQPEGSEVTLAARGEIGAWPTLQPVSHHQRAWQDQPAPQFTTSPKGWHYLSTTLREKIEHSPGELGRWKKIIITCTDEASGSARSLHQRDHDVLATTEGLRWHFVIGNGRGDAEGEVSVAPRWMQQQSAPAVVGADPDTIVIALVGDWTRRGPSDKQLAALHELVPFLHLHTGWVSVELDALQAGGKFPVTWLSQTFAKKLSPRYQVPGDPMLEVERNLQE